MDFPKEKVLQQLKKFKPEINKIYRGKTGKSPSHVLYYLESYYKRFSKIIELIWEVYPRGKGKKVLDIGIAYGFYDIILKNQFGFRVQGGELKKFIPKYCRLCQNHGIKVKAMDLMAEKLPFKKSEFNAVILAEIIEHLPISPYLLFKKINPIIKKGGYLLITIPNVAYFGNITKLLSGRNFLYKFDREKEIRQKIDTRTHVREYANYELEKDLKDSGFKVDKIEMVDGKDDEGLISGFIPNRYRRFIMIRAKKN